MDIFSNKDVEKLGKKMKPILKKEVLKEIILGGGEKKLSPERRFDATIFFTTQHLFK